MRGSCTRRRTSNQPGRPGSEGQMNKFRTLLAVTLALATSGIASVTRAADGAVAPFLPPYILESIAKHGNAAQRAQAQRQMLQDRAFVPGAMSQLEAQRR